VWQTRAAYRKRMVAGGDERARQSAKHAGTGMTDGRSLSVHDFLRMDDLTAESPTDRLMPEAHAQDRDPACIFLYRRHRHARFVGGTGSRRNHHTSRAHRPDLGNADLIVANHLHLGAQFAQILHQIPGEGIVVVDHQYHDSLSPSMPRIAISAARSTALAFARVSCHSLSGTESATIPAPA